MINYVQPKLTFSFNFKADFLIKNSLTYFLKEKIISERRLFLCSGTIFMDF